MDKDSLRDKKIWKLVFMRAGFVIVACMIWISTLFVVLGGNADSSHIKRIGEVAIVDLQVPAGLFH